jgi:hypothetical protein
MSGLTRDAKHFGGQLVYEALYAKRAPITAAVVPGGQDWVQAHALTAGCRVAREGNGLVALVGPALTVGVNEDQLTVDALRSGRQLTSGKTWTERGHALDR